MKQPSQISVVMPYRMEEPAILKHTVESLKSTYSNLEMIILEDLTGIGCGPMRHRGIMQASNDCILLTDPHMTFAPDSIQKMFKFWSKHKTDIICSASYANDTSSLVLDDSSKLVGYGCDIQKFAPESKRVFERPWRKTVQGTPEALGPITGYQVPCVLGACYMLSKSHYLGKLGGLWQYLVSTGWSEQAISIMQTLTGGKCWVIPEAKTLHLYRTSAAPYPTVPTWQIKNNQLLCLYTFVPSYLQKEYEQCLQLPENRTPDYGCKYLLKAGAFTRLAEVLAKYQTVTYEEASKLWL